MSAGVAEAGIDSADQRPEQGGKGRYAVLELPRALLEATSYGRPIVAANVSGCADFIHFELDRIIVEPDSVEVLEQAVSLLLQQPDLIEKIEVADRQRGELRKRSLLLDIRSSSQNCWLFPR